MKPKVTYYGYGALLLLCVSRSDAQPAPGPEAPSASRGAPAAPDLEITAHVSARELSFQQVGKVNVRFLGSPKRDTVWEEDRHNVSTPAQPGVTYRDIRSTFHVSSRFAEIERILEQALGGNLKPDSLPARTQSSTAAEQRPFPAIAAPLPPLPVSAAQIPAPKPVLPPKGVLPVKPLPQRTP